MLYLKYNVPGPPEPLLSLNVTAMVFGVQEYVTVIVPVVQAGIVNVEPEIEQPLFAETLDKSYPVLETDPIDVV